MYVMSSKIFEKSRPTEKLGEQDVLLAPPITLLGEQVAPPAPPVPAPMKLSQKVKSASMWGRLSETCASHSDVAMLLNDASVSAASTSTQSSTRRDDTLSTSHHQADQTVLSNCFDPIVNVFLLTAIGLALFQPTCSVFPSVPACGLSTAQDKVGRYTRMINNSHV